MACSCHWTRGALLEDSEARRNFGSGFPICLARIPLQSDGRDEDHDTQPGSPLRVRGSEEAEAARAILAEKAKTLQRGN